MTKRPLFHLVVILVLASCGMSFEFAYAESRVYDIEYIEKCYLEGRFEKAIQACRSLIDEKAASRDEIYYLKGISELKTKRFKLARETFEELISRYPLSQRDFDARVGIGDAYYLDGNSNKAAGAYNEVIVKYPSHSNIGIVQYKLGEAYKKLGWSDKAGEAFAAARKTAPLSFEVRGLGGSAVESSDEKAQPSLASNFAPSDVSCPRQTGSISVQVGSFKSRRNAEGLSRKLRKMGYESYIEIPVGQSDKIYRVKAGRFSTKREAESLESRLKGDGFKTKICGE